MSTITQVITPLPEAPSRADPASFATKSDTMVAALPPFVTQVNTVISEMNVVSGEIIAAAASVDTNTDLCVSSAAAANTSAAQAALAAPAWSAGTSYSFPMLVVGSDAHTYRCTGTSVVGADPTTNGGLWTRITGPSDAVKSFFLSQS